MQAVTLTLPSTLDIRHIEAVYHSLESAFTDYPPVCLNGAAVEKIDAVGIQIIISFLRECADHHMPVTWTEPSPTLQQLVEDLSLTDLVKF